MASPPPRSRSNAALSSRQQRRRRRRVIHPSFGMLLAAFLFCWCSAPFSSSSSRWQIGCDALSNPFSASMATVKAALSSQGGNNNNNNNAIQIKLANVANKNELEALQDCRRTAFDANKQNWMNSERDFVRAQSVLDEKHLCVVAFETKTAGKRLRIVGSADLYPTTKGKNTVMNVFVRPDQRGNGIGRRLMVDGIEDVLVPLLEGPNARMSSSSSSENSDEDDDVAATKEAVLTLDVYTQNKAAIELYLKLGYEPASPVQAGTLGLAKVLQANLLVSLSKTVVAVQ